jgi:hypothetical protein
LKIQLPKELRGFAYDGAIPFDMNDALLDTMLPTLFLRVVTEGRDVRTINADSTKIAESVESLATHARLQGFEGELEKRALDRLVRSSLVTIGYKGRGRREADKQIDGIVPYSLASFRVGFPKQRTRVRRIDQFIYQALLAQFREHPTAKVKTLFEDLFGQGIAVSIGPPVSATRVPSEDIDLLTDLSIAYLDSFPSITVAQSKSVLGRSIPTSLPAVQRRFGRDLYRYLVTYGSRLPTTILIRQLTALIGFELYVFTAKLMVALPELTANPDRLPPAMESGDPVCSPPELYVDFSSQITGVSRLMSVTALRRDIEATEDFVRAVLRLRYLNRLIDRQRKTHTLRVRIEQEIGSEDSIRDPALLQGLLRLQSDPDLELRLEAAALNDLDAIRHDNPIPQIEIEDEGELDDSVSNSLVDPLLDERLSPIDQIVELLCFSQQQKIQQNVVRWMTSVGGLGQPYGLMVGHTHSRRSWRYAPSNDLLAVLVQLAAIDYQGWHPEKQTDPIPVSLKHFLDWLELRFGLIVDRPPSNLGFDSPDHVAAARNNLQAMLRRLRQMGIFEDLSDDFSVQRLVPPFAEDSDADVAIARLPGGDLEGVEIT